SMGEVTLTLKTDNGHPAADDGRITLNRRVFRTGESEFRMNGRRVRMKDISDILMDTGLGIRNYSVMEQGKIDLIRSNKPQDRRRLIEEAAGIMKYKTKRRAAELKLEETQQNLLRIDDTLGEVTRNLNSLKRQAGKARRHRELTEQLSTAKRALYRGRIVVAQAEQEAAEQGVAAAQAMESELSAQLATDEAELAENRTLLAERGARASSLREEMASLSGDVEKCEFYRSKLGESARRALESRDGAAALVGEWEQRLREAEQALVSAQHTARDAVARRDDLASRRDAMRESLASARDTISQT